MVKLFLIGGVLMFFNKKKDLEPKRNRVGYYDVKPIKQIYDDLAYAKYVCLLNTEAYKVFAKGYKGCLSKIIFVQSYDEFIKFDYSNENLRDLNMGTDFEGAFSLDEFNDSKMIEIIVFEENSERTIAYAKKNFVVEKNHFRQILLFENKTKVLEYHRIMPDYYKLYTDYTRVIFLDMAAKDKEIL